LSAGRLFWRGGALTDDALKSLRARTSPGRLEFKDASQRDIAAPISFKGFGQAFDALVKD
jgi:invasion protein IalB